MYEPHMRDADAASSPITHEAIADIAAEAHAHVRTVERRLLGLKVKGRVAQRVDVAIARRGIAVRISAAPGGPTSGSDGR